MQRSGGKSRLPGWVLVVAPVFAMLVANSDVAALLVADPASRSGRLWLALGVTLPLSLLSGG